MTDHQRGVEQFTEYFVLNYPGPDTAIFDPKWHAPKIFRAAISAYLSTTEPGKPVAEAVKALEWRDGRNEEPVFDVVQHATILGAEKLVGLEYTILGPDRHGLFEVILGDKVINFGNSDEQAKVVAQLDYQRRIMSALYTPPQPVFADRHNDETGECEMVDAEPEMVAALRRKVAERKTYADEITALSKRCAELEAALRDQFCPRPCNGRPDQFDVGDCVDAGECGCSAALALIQEQKKDG